MRQIINLDPVQDGTNWYVYVNNNPLAKTDPTGLYSPMDYVGRNPFQQIEMAVKESIEYTKESFKAGGRKIKEGFLKTLKYMLHVGNEPEGRMMTGIAELKTGAAVAGGNAAVANPVGAVVGLVLMVDGIVKTATGFADTCVKTVTGEYDKDRQVNSGFDVVGVAHDGLAGNYQPGEVGPAQKGWRTVGAGVDLVGSSYDLMSGPGIMDAIADTISVTGDVDTITTQEED